MDRAALVGRDEELEALVRALSRDGARSISIVGPPGVGKTALAHALLLNRAGAIVSIDGVNDQSALVTALAGAAGVPLPAAETAREPQLLRALALRAPFVVVLDGAERSLPLVQEAVARFVSLTPDAPGLSFVVLSQVRPSLRFALPVPAPPPPPPPERTPAPVHVNLELDALPLPDATVTDPAVALESAAVRLFVTRARERSGFVLLPSDVPDVVALVRALDGLPLALVLGAARAAMLGLKRTRELLTRRFELLTQAGPGGRHQSLEAAIAWSWELLGPPERVTLACVSVFRGGFTVEAAHHVEGLNRSAGQAGQEDDELTTLARIETLLAASLLFVSAPPSAGRGARFDLFESVRAFARRAGASAAVVDAERRHGEFFVQAGEAWSRRVRGPDALDALFWLEQERANLVSVTERAEPILALRAALALEPVMLTRGPVPEHVTRIERLVASCRDAGLLDDQLHARAIASAGLAEIYAGRRTESVRRMKETLTLLDDSGEVAADVEALAASKAALVLGLTGSGEEATVLFARAERAAALSADPWMVGLVAKDRGMVLSEAGDNAAAISAFEDALRGFRRAGDAREEAFALAAIGARFLDEGALAEAKRHALRAVSMLETLGDRRTQAWSLLLLAIVSLDEGELDVASGYVARTLTCVRAIGDRLTEGLGLAVAGHVALEAGRSSQAVERYAEATELLEQLGDRRNVGIVLGAWSAASALLGERAQSERLFLRAQGHTRERGRPGDDDALALFGAVVRVRAAEDAAARGDRDGALAALREIDALLEAVTAPTSAVFRSDEVRLALRVARRARNDAEPRIRSMLSMSMRDASAHAAPTAPLVVAADGGWFRLPNGEVVKLRARPVAGRLLRALIDHAIAVEGTPVPAGTLIAAGWPGEKILPKAAQNRLYVAMTRLRQLGLGELLRNEGDGYFLRPGVSVRIARGEHEA